MKINIVIPFTDKTGGIIAILEHYRQLTRLGHDVLLYYPLLPQVQVWYRKGMAPRRFARGQLQYFVLNLLRYRRSLSWWPHPHRLKAVLTIRDAAIRNADAVVATGWPTAYSVAALSPSKGRKFYLIQGYEIWVEGTDPALVEKTYFFPFRIITIAPWLTQLLREKYGREVWAEVPNGVDLSLFRPPEYRDSDTANILMLYHIDPIKGTADGLAALRRIHEAFPGAPITLFGRFSFPDCPPYVRYVRDPPPDVLAGLYRESHVFLGPSRNEGWYLPILEAMASGCAVVTTRVGCVPLVYDGGNMLVVEPQDIEGMANGIAYLLKNPREREEMAEKGRATAQKYTWDKTGEKMAAALASGLL